MKTLDIRVTIASDRRLSLDIPVDMAEGEYNALLVVEDRPIASKTVVSVETAQALLRQYVPEGRNLADELISERKQENGYQFKIQNGD
ncbi:hypothetical protein [Roseofilum casamattae]|uniref:Uncharacterized protein n=1 Tax=Roseofilum casamattae BLCC-M143 TaxID=3022442 RepID=A0ABT7C0V7_9CYAN|nr:hypothetical protein [Roseofilum casamattae]MDJ1184148.1 hypothetical protein [Roseofilum casamattae BLCC-M143]